MYSSIISAIKTILSTVTEIKAVFDTEVTGTTAYPYATVMPVGHQDAYKSMRDIERIYTFTIRIYGNMTDTSTNTIKQVQICADKAVNALSKKANVSLSGTINYTKLTKGAFSFQQRESSTYVFECTYEASVLINRDTI